MRIILPIVIVTILAFATFLAIRSKTSTNTPTTETQTSSTLSPETQWIVYANSFLNFTIKRPSNWQILELDNEIIFASSKDGLKKDETRKQELRVFIGKTSLLENQDLKKYVAAIDERAKPKIIDEQYIKFDGKEAIKRIVNIDADPEYKMTLIYIETSNYVYSIAATPADSELTPIFDQMLQSLKFLQ